MLVVCLGYFEINQFVCSPLLELILTYPMMKQSLLRQLHFLRYYLFCSYLQSQPKDPKVFRCSFGASFGTSYLRILYSIEILTWISNLNFYLTPITPISNRGPTALVYIVYTVSPFQNILGFKGLTENIIKICPAADFWLLFFNEKLSYY